MCFVLQRTKIFFAGLKRYSKRSRSPLQEPGKTAYNMAGRYYGIAWLISCLDAAMSFRISTSAKVLWSYWWWFLSICRGWYAGERLALCIKNITIGRESVDWVVGEHKNSTFIKIDDVWRKKKQTNRHMATSIVPTKRKQHDSMKIVRRVVAFFIFLLL